MAAIFKIESAREKLESAKPSGTEQVSGVSEILSDAVEDYRFLREKRGR